MARNTSPRIVSTQYTPRRVIPMRIAPMRITLVPTLLVVAVLLVGLITACSKSTRSGIDSDPEDLSSQLPEAIAVSMQPQPELLCEPLPGSPVAQGRLVVALTDPVAPEHAPIPYNLSERIVFRNLYETLVTVNCDGSLHPGLAESWEASDDYTRWTFTLRPEARFWDGTPVTADEVIACWQRSQGQPAAAASHSPWSWLSADIVTLQAIETDRLLIEVIQSRLLLPLVLAHPACAVATERQGWVWPVGSGPGRLRATAIAPVPDIVCQPNLHHPDRPVWSALVFRVLPASDPRDLFTFGANILIARDRVDLSYFQQNAELLSTPLPWDRLYLLVTPEAVDRDVADRDVADLAAAVAAAAVLPADEPSFTVLTGPPCAELVAAVAAPTSVPLAWDPEQRGFGPGTLLYPASDTDARLLAERLIATENLATENITGDQLQPPPTGLERCVAVDTAEFAFQLQAGAAGAYLLPLPREYPSTCLTLSALLGRVGWLQTPVQRPPDPQDRHAPITLVDIADGLHGRVLPLVYTHPYLVTHGRLAGLQLAYDGTPLFGRAGWAEAVPEAQP